MARTSRKLNDVLNMKYVAGSASGANARRDPDLGAAGQAVRQAGRRSTHGRVPGERGARRERLRISGIYTTRRFTGAFPIDFIVSRELFEQSFAGNQQDTLIYVKAKPGQAAAVGRRMAKDLAEPFPNIKVESRTQYLHTREQDRRPVPERVLRAPAALRDHRGAWHREHADAVDLRTDTRGRAAAHRRNDPAPDLVNGLRRVGDHRGDRLRARPLRRRALGLGGDEGRCGASSSTRSASRADQLVAVPRSRR